jgi:hypothetical protein
MGVDALSTSGRFPANALEGPRETRCPDTARAATLSSVANDVASYVSVSVAYELTDVVALESGAEELSIR